MLLEQPAGQLLAQRARSLFALRERDQFVLLAVTEHLLKGGARLLNELPSQTGALIRLGRLVAIHGRCASTRDLEFPGS